MEIGLNLTIFFYFIGSLTSVKHSLSMTLFSVIIPLDSSSAQGGQILLGQAMHSHQMDVSVLLPLELLATHVAGAMHVQLHVGVKLGKQSVDYV